MTQWFSATLVAGALMCTPTMAEESRTFDLPNFDRIDVSAGIVLIADVGGPQSIIVKTTKGNFSDFSIEVKNGELNLSRERNRLAWHNRKSDYKVIVTVPALRALGASSGAHAKISKINVAHFAADLSSGAQASLDGVCENCVLDLSSGAYLTAKGLKCRTARIDVSSGGRGEITATDAVVADASSGGYFAVYGSPPRIDRDNSSGGRIEIVSAVQANRD